MTADLRQYFLTNLSASVRPLMDEIEDTIGQAIRFEPTSSHTWGGETRKTGMRIIIPANTPFSQHSACHELIHIKRYALQNQPQLLATRDWETYWKVTAGQIKNDTEHSLMAAEEEAYGFDPKSYWAIALEDRASTMKQGHPTKVRGNLFLLLQYLDCVTPAFAERLLAAAKATGNADVITKAGAIRKHLAVNKPAALRKLVQSMGLDVGEFEMIYVNLANGTEKIVGLRQA